MIKFFRKIRQNLLMENKTGKYFKYAIGEIILVVIGILIALQINNWNENRKNNSKVNTYLNNMIQDLTTDQESLNEMYSQHSFKFYSMQYLLTLEGSNPYDPIGDRKDNIPQFQSDSIWDVEIPKLYDLEFIRLAFNQTNRDFIYPIAKTTFEELKSSGMFSNINSDLTKKISFYNELWEDYFNGKVESLALDWQESLAEDGYIAANAYKLSDPMSLIKDNPKRIGLMNRMTKESGWTLQAINRLKIDNKKLIQLLEKEIAGF
jgi:hypothetical protein